MIFAAAYVLGMHAQRDSIRPSRVLECSQRVFLGLYFIFLFGICLPDTSFAASNDTTLYSATTFAPITNTSAPPSGALLSYVVYPGNAIEAVKLEKDINDIFSPDYVQTIRSDFTGIAFWVIQMANEQRKEILRRNPTVHHFGLSCKIHSRSELIWVLGSNL